MEVIKENTWSSAELGSGGEKEQKKALNPTVWLFNIRFGLQQEDGFRQMVESDSTLVKILCQFYNVIIFVSVVLFGWRIVPKHKPQHCKKLLEKYKIKETNLLLVNDHAIKIVTRPTTGLIENNSSIQQYCFCSCSCTDLLRFSQVKMYG